MRPKDNNKSLSFKKINPLSSTVFLLALMTILSAGCGGGNRENNTDDDPRLSKAQFRIKLLNDSNSNQPLADIYVSLHNADNKTIAKTLITDSNGIADFGNIASTFPGAINGNPGRITVTTSYTDPLSKIVEIYTNFNILIENYTFYIRLQAVTNEVKLNVEFNSIRASDTNRGARLEPLGTKQPIEWGQ